MIGSMLTEENRNKIYAFLNITGVGTNPKVYTVTKTDDYDDDRNPSRYEGTLRYALEAGTGPRIIKFQLPDNSQIFLKKPLLPKEGNFIVDGKSGAVNLQISGFGLVIENLSNFVFDNIRFYRGDRAILNKPPYNDGKNYRRKLDTLEILTASQFAFFNCEFAWGADGLADIFDAQKGIFYGCTLEHPLANPEVHYENGRPQRHDLAYSIRGANQFYVVNCFVGPLKERGPNIDTRRRDFDGNVDVALLGNITGFIKAAVKVNEPEESGVNAKITIQDCLFYPIIDPTSGVRLSEAKPIIVEPQKKGLELNLVDNQFYQNGSRIPLPIRFDREKDKKYLKNTRITSSFSYLAAAALYDLIAKEGMVIGAQPPNEYTLSLRRDILGYTGKPLISQDDLRTSREAHDVSTTTATFLPSGGPSQQKTSLQLTPKATLSEEMKPKTNIVRARM